MELKDMILSTLAELEEPVVEEQKEEVRNIAPLKPPTKDDEEVENPGEPQNKEDSIEPVESSNVSDERAFCENMRERILVLFEGFQSPNNKNIEAKVDLTLNFLEYLLAIIDERLENLDSKGK